MYVIYCDFIENHILRFKITTEKLVITHIKRHYLLNMLSIPLQLLVCANAILDLIWMGYADLWGTGSKRKIAKGQVYGSSRIRNCNLSHRKVTTRPFISVMSAY